jgi:acylphosphatase
MAKGEWRIETSHSPLTIHHSPKEEIRMGGESDVRTVRVRIAGRVQGVSYRYWTEVTAHGLGLTGWVRNRRDGSVEALFSGAADDVADMLQRCHDGPAAAVVSCVEVVAEGGDQPARFEVLPTA